MGDVIQFPTNDARRIAEIEGIIRDYLRKHGASEKMTNTVLDNMADFLKILNFEFSFSVNEHNNGISHEQIDALNKALKHRTNQLLLDRVLVEIDRCHLLGVQ